MIMIVVTGNIKINPGDNVLFENPTIQVEADAELRNRVWTVKIRAVLSAQYTGEVVKQYVVSGSDFSRYDEGNGEFASNLATIIDQFVVMDLASFNTEATFQIQ